MFENIMNFFKNIGKTKKQETNSKDTAKERLHLVLMQDRANVSADFLEMMKQEIIEVIKKYIDVDENAIDVRLTNKTNEDGTTGAPALYANIPIVSIKEETKSLDIKMAKEKEELKEEKKEDKEEVKEKTATPKKPKQDKDKKVNIEKQNKKEEISKESKEEVKEDIVKQSDVQEEKKEEVVAKEKEEKEEPKEQEKEEPKEDHHEEESNAEDNTEENE